MKNKEFLTNFKYISKYMFKQRGLKNRDQRLIFYLVIHPVKSELKFDRETCFLFYPIF